MFVVVVFDPLIQSSLERKWRRGSFYIVFVPQFSHRRISIGTSVYQKFDDRCVCKRDRCRFCQSDFEARIEIIARTTKTKFGDEEVLDKLVFSIPCQRLQSFEIRLLDRLAGVSFYIHS